MPWPPATRAGAARPERLGALNRTRWLSDQARQLKSRYRLMLIAG